MNLAAYNALPDKDMGVFDFHTTNENLIDNWDAPITTNDSFEDGALDVLRTSWCRLLNRINSLNVSNGKKIWNSISKK